MTKRKPKTHRVKVCRVEGDGGLTVWNAACTVCPWETWRMRWQSVVTRAVAHSEGRV